MIATEIKDSHIFIFYGGNQMKQIKPIWNRQVVTNNLRLKSSTYAQYVDSFIYSANKKKEYTKRKKT